MKPRWFVILALAAIAVVGAVFHAAKVADLTGELDKLGAGYASLAINHKRLQSDYSSLKSDYESLRTSYDELQGEVEKLRAPYLRVEVQRADGLKATVNGLTISNVDNITRIHWDWGDGSSGDSWFPASHAYAAGGTYTISVTAYDSAGRSTTNTVTVTVRA
ncbi:MAG: PKD domain-containing protein [Chloroflexi bacterium]|nr:PKD domain-containing protein [Chloroflexota bacterium]